MAPLLPRSVALRAAGIGLALAAAGASAPGTAPGEPGPLGGHAGGVTARLLSEVVQIAPGEPFRVGIEITMAPGWHTYWENGGDAGLPTTVEWDLPDGFRAGEILWPVPHRYEEGEDLVTFGYETRVLLLTEITPPSTLGDDPVEIRAAVEWLQCKDICIPGGAEVDLRLPVGDAAKPAAPAVLRAFADADRLLPHPAVSLENVAVHAFQSLDAIPPGEMADVAVVFSGLRDYDLASSLFFPGPSGELWMRDGTFRTDGANLALVIPVEVDAAVSPGSVVALSGVVRLPRTSGTDPLLLSFEIPVTVAEEGVAGRASEAPVFAAGTGSFLPVEGEGPRKRVGGPGALGLLRYVLLAFLGGIILNVMPCVLPVISLKILGFVSKADEDPGKVTRLGWTFGAGVVVSFLLLAFVVVVLQAAGEHIGWGFQFQNPAFVAGLSVVVLVFALSLLGVFEVGAVTSMIGLGQAAKQRRDYADAFFHGVLTTILATPCTAPMLGTAIAFAFSQPPAIVFLIFLSVSLGLAFPYLLLSMHPAWLRYVPKPGPWMDRFKQGMGFLLLATLVWLLFVFGAQTGSDTLTWLLAFLLVVGFFCWVHGTFLDLSSRRARVLLVWGLTIAGVGLGYRSFLHERLFSAAPAEGTGTAPRVEVTAGGIRWEPFSVEYLDRAVRSGRTVFLDFTADWCWTCKVNEKTVLADSDVERMLRENRVLTLKGDWTRKDPEITEILQRHARAGVPFYAVYPAGRPSEVIVLPEIINKRLVLDSLEKAGPSRPTAPGRDGEPGV